MVLWVGVSTDGCVVDGQLDVLAGTDRGIATHCYVVVEVGAGQSVGAHIVEERLEIGGYKGSASGAAKDPVYSKLKTGETAGVGGVGGDGAAGTIAFTIVKVDGGEDLGVSGGSGGGVGEEEVEGSAEGVALAGTEGEGVGLCDELVAV